MTKQRDRVSPVEMSPDEFRLAGHRMIDRIADFVASLPDRPVTPGESLQQIREQLGNGSLPEQGGDTGQLLEDTAKLLFDHSLLNGHPRFWGYITSSAAPIGALGDLLAGAVNPNMGAWALSPVATEIEAQTVRWIAQLLGFPPDCGGLLVSGGNMANMVGLWAARKAKAGWDVRGAGLMTGEGRQLLVYASSETHTWIQKAADLSGLGTDAVHWVPADEHQRMDTNALRRQLREDTEKGDLPFLVVGTAGSVSTGAVDPLPELASICREHDVWFHVDGAYGGFAAALPDASPELKGLSEADSVAVDPHKWLYAPLEAACVLVRDPQHLQDAFSFHPPYYKFDGEGDERPINYNEYGPQNSRGFRALKVWLGLKQAGREGYERMIADDIRLAKALYQLVDVHPSLQAMTQNLSITTFRYLPLDLEPSTENIDAYLNELNTELLTRLQNSGEAYPSHAVINGVFALRVCIVNFRTALADIEALPEIVVRLGEEVDSELRPASSKPAAAVLQKDG